jgi:hypothetical protein
MGDNELLVKQGILMPQAHYALTFEYVQAMNGWAEKAFAAIRADERERAAKVVSSLAVEFDGASSSRAAVTFDVRAVVGVLALLSEEIRHGNSSELLAEWVAAIRGDGEHDEH